MRQPLLLLGLVAKPVDRHGAQPHARLQGDRHRGVHPGELLQRQAEGEVVASHPAVLLGEGQAEQPHLAHVGHDLVGELRPLVELPDDGGDLGPGETLDGGAQSLVLGAQVGVPITAAVPARQGLHDPGRTGPPELGGHPEAGGNQGVEVHSGCDTKTVQLPHQVLGRQVAGGALGVGAAAQAAGRGVDGGHARLQGSQRVRQGLTVGVVEMHRDVGSAGMPAAASAPIMSVTCPGVATPMVSPTLSCWAPMAMS